MSNERRQQLQARIDVINESIERDVKAVIDGTYQPPIDREAELREVKADRIILEARWERTQAALRLVLARCRDPNASATENYERVTEEFWRETGYMAPGKDQPVALGGAGPQERRDVFDAWEKRKWLEAWAAAKAVLS